MYVEDRHAGATKRPWWAGDAREPDPNELRQYVTDVLGVRAINHVSGTVGDFLVAYGVTSVILAGGALLHGEPKDLDLFPCWSQSPAAWAALLYEYEEGREARFACVRVGGRLLQCVRPDGLPLGVDNLVKSFDFAHCQVGVRLLHQKVDNVWLATEVAWTPAFQAAMLTGGTFYVGGRMPLNSLARVARISQKLDLTLGETRELAFQVVRELAKDVPALDHLFMEGTEAEPAPKVAA